MTLGDTYGISCSGTWYCGNGLKLNDRMQFFLYQLKLTLLDSSDNFVVDSVLDST